MVSQHIALIFDHNLCQQLVRMLRKDVLAGRAWYIIHLQVGVLSV